MSSQDQNRAAFVDAKGTPVRIGEAPMPSVEADEVLVHNSAAAINPVDWKMQDSGRFVQNWPVVLGCDVSGTIVSVGSNVTHLKSGQRVLAHTIALGTGQNRQAGFQHYTATKAILTSPIPENMSFESASVLPLALSTAITGLYQPNHLGLPLPTHNPKPTGKTLLCWGGSSSVGSTIIQLAVASGLRVVATASKRNFEYCKSLGAHAVFDYNSPSVVGDVTAELQKGQVAGAFDAVGQSPLAIGTILAQLGGGKHASVTEVPQDTVPATVTAARVFALEPMLKYHDVAKAIYEDWLPQALASGQMKPMPEAQVVGRGLENVQPAIDKLRAGVSATKLVVSLP